MGYFIEIEYSDAYIPKENLEIAYQKMCELNVTHHDVKRGRWYLDGKELSRSFSWMDENYPDTCKDAKEILEMLGFHTDYNTKGDLCITYYDNKMGQEDLFLEAITPYTYGTIRWWGEDNKSWTNEFQKIKVVDDE